MSTILIAGRSFDVPFRYTEGHTLTANEASAMNQLLGENLRNNFASKVKEMEDKHGKELPAEVTEELASRFAAYAGEYEFGVRRSRGPAAASNPVEAEALKIMLEMIISKIKATGKKVSAFKREDLIDKAKSFLEDKVKYSSVWDLAKSRVAEKQALVSNDIDDLSDLEEKPASVEAEPAPAEAAPPKVSGRPRKAA